MYQIRHCLKDKIKIQQTSLVLFLNETRLARFVERSEFKFDEFVLHENDDVLRFETTWPELFYFRFGTNHFNLQMITVVLVHQCRRDVKHFQMVIQFFKIPWHWHVFRLYPNVNEIVGLLPRVIQNEFEPVLNPKWGTLARDDL